MQAAGSLSPGQILIIVLIVLVLFGGKRLRSFGSDLGEAIKGFKNTMSNDDKKDSDVDEETPKNLEQEKKAQSVKQTEQSQHKD